MEVPVVMTVVVLLGPVMSISETVNGLMSLNTRASPKQSLINICILFVLPSISVCLAKGSYSQTQLIYCVDLARLSCITRGRSTTRLATVIILLRSRYHSVDFRLISDNSLREMLLALQ
jgi:hypothetical protein